MVLSCETITKRKTLTWRVGFLLIIQRPCTWQLAWGKSLATGPKRQPCNKFQVNHLCEIIHLLNKVALILRPQKKKPEVCPFKWKVHLSRICVPPLGKFIGHQCFYWKSEDCAQIAVPSQPCSQDPLLQQGWCPVTPGASLLLLGN